MAENQPRCATCDRAVYWSGIPDHVGRRTSDGRWTHHDGAANADHEVTRAD